MTNNITPERFLETEAFLFTEAKLLDEKKYDTWLTLFTADAYYWLPLDPEQCDPTKEPSIIYEDFDMLKVRIHWLEHPNNHAQAMQSRTVHNISNVLVENIEEDSQSIVVSCALQVAEYHNEKETTYNGRCNYVLQIHPTGLKIKSKRVDLINSKGPLKPIPVLL